MVSTNDISETKTQWSKRSRRWAQAVSRSLVLATLSQHSGICGHQFCKCYHYCWSPAKTSTATPVPFPDNQHWSKKHKRADVHIRGHLSLHFLCKVTVIFTCNVCQGMEEMALRKMFQNKTQTTRKSQWDEWKKGKGKIKMENLIKRSPMLSYPNPTLPSSLGLVLHLPHCHLQRSFKGSSAVLLWASSIKDTTQLNEPIQLNLNSFPAN